MKITHKYTAKKPFFIAYIILVCICILLTIGRWYSVFDNDFVFINAEIHSHLSNLVLSMVFYLAAGNVWLLSGVRFRFIVLLGVFLIISNFVCETLMGFMNTTDIIDAVYGTIGTGVAFLYLFVTYKYGLVPINSEEL